MSRSTMRGSRIWLTFCLISCLLFSSLLSYIIINQLLIMIRKVFTSKAWLPIARPNLKSSSYHSVHPILSHQKTALGFNGMLFNKFTFNFSDDKHNKKPNNQKKPEKKDEEGKTKTEQDEKEGGKQQIETWQQRIEKFIDNFWEKPDPNDPHKKPPSKPEQLFKKFGNLIEGVMQHLRSFYYRKFRVSSVLLVLLGFYIIFKYIGYEKELSPQVFIQLLRMHSFEKVEFIEDEYFRNNQIPHKKITGTLNGQKYFCQVLSFDEVLAYVVKDGNIKYKNIRRSSFQSALNSIYQVIDTVFILFILGTIIRAPKGSMGGGAQMGPQPKKFDIIKNVHIKFNDVAGLHQSKREVQEVVDFLKNPEKYHALGATIPKGVLLTGPPGTGKTMLAKACAGEAGVPFFSVSGSDFVEVFVGVGASRVRQLFQQAKEQSPSIIFIDQLDAVGKKRQNKMGSNDQRESTLNQLLVEMDGFGTNAKVIVMAATNRKDILDNALVRPGRFDRQVQVGLPDLRGRYEILLVHLKPLVLSQKYTHEDYAKRIASLTPGFSGAELANLCNQAAILAARCGKERVQMLDFELSSQRVIGGVERKGFVSIYEKKTVAYHESGHAVVSWFLEGADPLLKVSIIPRSKGALGFAQYFLNENQLQTRQQLMDRICFILGGRCSQLFFFNQITTGAYDDLQKAYNIAYHIVAKFGMDTALGYIAFPDPQYTKPYGQKVQALIDAEIKKIIDECTERTKTIIRKHEKDIKNLAQELLVKETVDVRTIVRILGERPFPINKTFQAYLETEQTQ